MVDNIPVLLQRLQKTQVSCPVSVCLCVIHPRRTPPPFYQGTASGDQLVSPERTKISRQAVRPTQLRGKLRCPGACPAERCLPRGKRADAKPPRALPGQTSPSVPTVFSQWFSLSFLASRPPTPPPGHSQGPFRSWRPCPLQSGISVSIFSFLLWCVCFTCQALQGRLISLIS